MLLSLLASLLLASSAVAQPSAAACAPFRALSNTTGAFGNAVSSSSSVTSDFVAATDAVLFSVVYADTYKYVTVNYPSFAAYVLYSSKAGCVRPSDAQLLAAHPHHDVSATKFFAVPVTSVAVGGTAPMPYLVRPSAGSAA
jgi:hypothetical protein